MSTLTPEQCSLSGTFRADACDVGKELYRAKGNRRGEGKSMGKGLNKRTVADVGQSWLDAQVQNVREKPI